MGGRAPPDGGGGVDGECAAASELGRNSQLPPPAAAAPPPPTDQSCTHAGLLTLRMRAAPHLQAHDPTKPLMQPAGGSRSDSAAGHRRQHYKG